MGDDGIQCEYYCDKLAIIFLPDMVLQLRSTLIVFIPHRNQCHQERSDVQPWPDGSDGVQVDSVDQKDVSNTPVPCHYFVNEESVINTPFSSFIELGETRAMM